MSETGEIKLGIVGCGGISHSHARGAKNCRLGVRFVACCDVQPDTAREWASKYGCQHWYTDYEEMIGAEDLDAVVLATWPNQHREQIEKCLAAGAKHILCEKALTVTGPEALDVWRMVKQAGALLVEAFTYRHHPRMCALDELLRTRGFGPVESIHAAFSGFDSEEADPNDATRNWRQRAECSGGIPWDFACYPVNACGWLAASLPARAYCVGRHSPKYRTINRMHGIIQYASGCVGLIESDKQSERQDLDITLADAMIDLPNGCWDQPPDSEYLIEIRRDTRKDDKEIVRSEPGDRFALQLEHFADVLAGKRDPVLPLYQSVVNMFALDALVTSLEEQRLVEIAIPDEIVKAFEKDKGGKS